ncbi:MAG TPA: DUF2202 domain-containing protein [Ignavibacteria bacterium]|nr:DUF2202 domain-containing protein [Ignavibacteria bacterium]HMQ98360.1 DUF2202 domain-containing protein [Ignavibacteria bacterium]
MKRIILIAWMLLFSSIAAYSSDIKNNRELFLKLYQEEKLAYDLYGEFYERWSLGVFNKVQQREAKHVWCVERIMDNYGFDYNTNTIAGSYPDRDIQKIYDDLTVKGCISDLAALEAAAYIKEKHISQLRERIRYQEDEYVVKVIFLMESAAQSHLRAFVKSIRLSGSDYSPVFLTDDEFSRIMETDKTIAGE